MSPDSDTDTLTFSGLDDDSAGFDAIRVNIASAPLDRLRGDEADDLHRGRADGEVLVIGVRPFPGGVDGPDEEGKIAVGEIIENERCARASGRDESGGVINCVLVPRDGGAAVGGGRGPLQLHRVAALGGLEAGRGAGGEGLDGPVQLHGERVRSGFPFAVGVLGTVCREAPAGRAAAVHLAGGRLLHPDALSGGDVDVIGRVGIEVISCCQREFIEPVLLPGIRRLEGGQGGGRRVAARIRPQRNRYVRRRGRWVSRSVAASDLDPGQGVAGGIAARLEGLGGIEADDVDPAKTGSAAHVAEEQPIGGLGVARRGGGEEEKECGCRGQQECEEQRGGAGYAIRNGGDGLNSYHGHCLCHLASDFMGSCRTAKRWGRASEVVRPVAKRNETAQLCAVVSGPLANLSNAKRNSPLILGKSALMLPKSYVVTVYFNPPSACILV